MYIHYSVFVLKDLGVFFAMCARKRELSFFAGCSAVHDCRKATLGQSCGVLGVKGSADLKVNTK